MGEEIERLWDLFAAAMGLSAGDAEDADERDALVCAFIHAYDAVARSKIPARTHLATLLCWIDPVRFAPLETTPSTGTAYLEALARGATPALPQRRAPRIDPEQTEGLAREFLDRLGERPTRQAPASARAAADFGRHWDPATPDLPSMLGRCLEDGAPLLDECGARGAYRELGVFTSQEPEVFGGAPSAGSSPPTARLRSASPPSRTPAPFLSSASAASSAAPLPGHRQAPPTARPPHCCFSTSPATATRSRPASSRPSTSAARSAAVTASQSPSPSRTTLTWQTKWRGFSPRAGWEKNSGGRLGYWGCRGFPLQGDMRWSSTSWRALRWRRAATRGRSGATIAARSRGGPGRVAPNTGLVKSGAANGTRSVLCKASWKA